MVNNSSNEQPRQTLLPAHSAPIVQAPQSVIEVLESISDAFFALDREWRFTYLNTAAGHLLKRERQELLGKCVWDEFPEAVRTTFYRQYHLAIRQNVTVEFVEYYPPLETWFSVRAYPTPTGLAVYFQNINEQRRRTEELQLAHERFTYAVLAVECLIYDVDLRTDTVFRSEGLYTLLGYHPNEIPATREWGLTQIHPDDILTLSPAFRALDDPSQPQVEVEYRLRHRDGHYIDVHDRALILRDEQGKAIRLVGSLSDISARRTAEKDLRESEERHRIITELTSDYNYALALTANGSSQLDLVTEGFTRITGYTLEEVNARGGWAILVHPEDMVKAKEEFERSLSGNVNASVIRIITKQGETRWVRNLNKPVRDPVGGFVVRIVGAAQDITERKLAEEELCQSRERLQALSRQLIAAQENERRHLAHELHDEIGQTLTAIAVTLQAAKADAGEAAQARLQEALAIVDRAIEQARHLSLDLRPSMLDDLGLRAALRWCADRSARRTGLAIYLDTNLGDHRLPGELETACFRVAQEALTNVARHAQARRVWIELLHRGDVVELSIRDDGVGFDPLNARRRALEGASFGLLGMQERTELLGGQFTIESKPGQGTSIRVCFPFAPVPAPGRE